MAHDTDPPAVKHYVADSGSSDREIHLYCQKSRPGAVSYNQESNKVSHHDTEKKKPVLVAVFHVKSSALIQSNHFQSLLRAHAAQHAIDLYDDDEQALHVWLRILHQADLDGSHSSSTICTAWEILTAAKKYELDPKLATAWYTTWFERSREDIFDDSVRIVGDSNDAWMDPYLKLRMLLFPCLAMDYAKGFLDVTRALAYGVRGHITEATPLTVGRADLHLPPNIIQQLNAAKGRLRNVLHAVLYRPIEMQIRAGCDHKEKMLYAFEKKLYETHAWPLEQTGHRNSIEGLLKKLGKVDGEGMPKSCSFCFINVTTTVRAAIKQTDQYFRGLCLARSLSPRILIATLWAPDCMPKSKLQDEHQDYWHHSEIGVWDHLCRVKHGNPTWYFSFMGRRHLMIEWVKQNKKQSADGPGSSPFVRASEAWGIPKPSGSGSPDEV